MLRKLRVIVPVLALVAIVLAFTVNAEAKKGEALTGVVNINTATADELVLLPGIGPSKASAIVSHRENEKFDSVGDLTKVKGIGEKLFSKIQAYVTVDGPTTAKMIKDVSLDYDTPTAGEEG